MHVHQPQTSLSLKVFRLRKSLADDGSLGRFSRLLLRQEHGVAAVLLQGLGQSLCQKQLFRIVDCAVRLRVDSCNQKNASQSMTAHHVGHGNASQHLKQLLRHHRTHLQETGQPIVLHRISEKQEGSVRLLKTFQKSAAVCLVTENILQRSRLVLL